METRTSTTTSSSTTSSSNNKATRSKAFAQLTSDYSSDDMTPEAKRKQLSPPNNNKANASTSTRSTVTTMFTNTSKRLGNALNARLTGATSTPRSQLETTQNVLNSTQEQQQRSNADWSQDHLAYIEYRDAGEYWK